MPSRILQFLSQLGCGAICGVLAAAVSHAGGLYVGEFATPSTGTANAGAAAHQLSFGGGPLVVYGTLDWDLSPGLPTPPGGEGRLKLKGLDDADVTGVYSVLIEPTDTLRFGLVFQDDLELKLKGRIKGAVVAGAALDLNLPLAQRFQLSSYWQATERLALLFSFDWEDWSTLEKTAVSIAGTGATVTLGFQDTFKVGGGVEYRLRDDLLLQTGVTYDTSALNNKHRTVALPIDRQIRWGIGAIWDHSDSLTIAFNFEFADLGNSKVRQGSVRGNYDQNQLFFFGVMLNWKNVPWKDWGKLPDLGA